MDYKLSRDVYWMTHPPPFPRMLFLDKVIDTMLFQSFSQKRGALGPLLCACIFLMEKRVSPKLEYYPFK